MIKLWKQALLYMAFMLPLCAFTQDFKPTVQQTEALKQQAQKMVAAFKAKDYATFVTYTPPGLIKLTGGKANMIAMLKQSVSAMQSQGAEIVDASLGNTGKMVKENGVLFNVVTEVLQVNFNGNPLTRASSLLAYSTDNGIHWYFVESAVLKKKEAGKILPKIPQSVISQIITPEQHATQAP